MMSRAQEAVKKFGTQTPERDYDVLCRLCGKRYGDHMELECPPQSNPRRPRPDVQPGDWLNSLTSAERKEIAISRGLMAYFPDALALMAQHSVRSNEKHNPGQPVHWSREKSSDHEDCIGRHSIAVAVDPNSLDGGAPHIVCRAWRALAALQLWAESVQYRERVK